MPIENRMIRIARHGMSAVSCGKLIQKAGIDKHDVDGFAVSSFSLGVDSVSTLTQYF